VFPGRPTATSATSTATNKHGLLNISATRGDRFTTRRTETVCQDDVNNALRHFRTHSNPQKFTDAPTDSPPGHGERNMIANAFATIVESAKTAAANLHQDERGQGMTEYVIILVAIAIVCIAIAVSFGGKIKGLFETADAEIDNVDSNL